jgi:hypothetical protein
MSSPSPRPISLLVWLLRVAPLVGVVAFGSTMIGAAISGIWLVANWVSALQQKLDTLEAEEVREHDAIARHQASMVDVDKRLNEIVASAKEVSAAREAEIQRLHNDSDAADAQMRARIDVLDERSKFTADRALGPPLPQPRGRQ